jgi:RNA polymerase primary sigma factor
MVFYKYNRRYAMREKREYVSEYTLDEIAKRLGVTRERVRQIERTALKKLKSPKVSKKLREYIEQ